MNEKLYKFTYEAFMWLHDNVETNINHYKYPDANFVKLLNDNSIKDYREETDVVINGSLSMKPPKDSKRHLADHQALDFYHSLEGMTPRMASEPEVLAYINHFYLHEYGLERWPLRGKATLVDNIRKHWLTKSNQKTDIYKSSISGRTWWIAHFSHIAANASNGAFEPKDALNVFTTDPEYYHRIMEFRIMRYRTTMAECVRTVMKESAGVNRKGFREICGEINRDGGARIIDSLPQSDIRKLFMDISDKIMGQAKFVNSRKFLRGVKPLKVLSLGAGTQSTVMALMAKKTMRSLKSRTLRYLQTLAGNLQVCTSILNGSKSSSLTKS